MALDTKKSGFGFDMEDRFKKVSKQDKNEVNVAEPAAAPESEESTVETTQPPADILSGLKADKPSAKSYAFYLSDGNVKKLKKLAKQQNVSASKLLDHILSEVLK